MFYRNFLAGLPGYPGPRGETVRVLNTISVQIIFNTNTYAFIRLWHEFCFNLKSKR